MCTILAGHYDSILGVVCRVQFKVKVRVMVKARVRVVVKVRVIASVDEERQEALVCLFRITGVVITRGACLPVSYRTRAAINNSFLR